MTAQPTLFRELGDDPPRLVPEGFRYQEEIISEAEEVALAASLTTLELKPFEFHGHLGNRRVTSFGLRYDYARRAVEAAQSFPAFVTELRNKVAKFAGREVEEFSARWSQRIPSRSGDRLAQGQAGVRSNRRRLTSRPGNNALSTPQGKRLDAYIPNTQAAIDLHPGRRIANALWEHSIPPLDALRYSLTFRTLR